ncbi:MAG: TIGR01459 family HAD-type hydrolase [Sedimentitalea sp.]|uniref:TIGR01459 family HAD-type hydrolase n=1 Tax=Sedimentitalea sp. TaxID=2048915 RepID=UPI003265C301
MTEVQNVTPAEAFAAYLKVRNRLPAAAGRGRAVPGEFLDIADDFDLILFDAYGVLNVGETAIPGAAETMAALRGAGKTVAVVSNSAAYSKAHMMGRYARLGFNFDPSEVVTSREALFERIKSEPPRRWGVMLNPISGLAELETLDAHVLTDTREVYDEVDGFLLIGSDGWTEHRQGLLEATLARTSRPVFIGNPDLVAPREAGLSLEPGWFAHRLADRTGIAPVFLGKPFPEIFELALARFGGSVPPERVLMVGDTLHTDILGGAQAGFATALVTAHGSLAGLSVVESITASKIAPDFVVETI